MSFNVISELITGLENVVQGVLGSEYKKLDYVFEISKNSLQGNPQRFGVITKGGISDSGVTRALTMNQDFEIMLVDSYINRDQCDEKQRELVNKMHEKIFEIFDSIFLTKAGKPEYVMNLNRLNISEIDFLTDDNAAILRATINIIYRQRLSN